MEYLINDSNDILVDNLTDDLKALIHNIIEFMDGSSLDDTFVAKVLLRLGSFGYVFSQNSNDDLLISFAIKKVESHIKSLTNCAEIDNNLIPLAIDRVCGEVLFCKMKSNQLSELPFDFDSAVKSLQLGDTNVTYAIGEGTTTDEQKATALISYLMNEGESDLLCYRKVSW